MISTQSQNVHPNKKAGKGPIKRLMKEVKEFCKDKTEGISAFPDPSRGILFWKAKLEGAKNTIYAGIKYELVLEFPAEYPMMPPRVAFTTPCYHPNVHEKNGDICLDILQDKWSCVYNVKTVLLSIQSLLSDPNTASPLNTHAAQLWDHDLDAYKEHLDKFHKDNSSK